MLFRDGQGSEIDREPRKLHALGSAQLLVRLPNHGTDSDVKEFFLNSSSRATTDLITIVAIRAASESGIFSS